MFSKSELVKQVHGKVQGVTKTQISAADVKIIVDALFENLKEALANGGKVGIDGFGSFEIRERQARIGRNPQKPEERIEIPARKAAVFRAGKALRDMLNPPKETK